MSDEKLKLSLEEMLADMAKKMMPLVRKGPGTVFRLTFTKDSAKAEFFMGDALVLSFTFEDTEEHGKNEDRTKVSPGKN